MKTARMSDCDVRQIAILKALAGNTAAGPVVPRQVSMVEIAQASGLSDEREVQRYLFILEGHKLVAPCPEGDFTSKIWQITADGISVVRSIRRATQAAA